MTEAAWAVGKAERELLRVITSGEDVMKVPHAIKRYGNARAWQALEEASDQHTCEHWANLDNVRAAARQRYEDGETK